VDRFVAIVKRLSFGLVIASWSFVPLIILGLAAFRSDACSSHPSLLLGPLALWALAAFFLFCYTQRRHYRAESIESLTCTIFLGLVSMGISSVSVLGSPFNLPATFSPDGGHLALPPLPPPARTLWVAAIDLSPDALRQGPEREDRLKLIDRAMRSIFLQEGAASEPLLAGSLQPLDSLHVYASNPTGPDWTNELGGEGRKDQLAQVVANLHENLTAKLSPLVEEPAQPRTIMRFLGGTLCAEIRSRPGVFQRVRIIVFSTWEQLAKVPRGEETPDLNALKQCLSEDSPRSSLLVFCLPSQGQASGDGCGSTLHALHSYLPASQWQDISLAAYDQLPAAKKTVALEALYNVPPETETPVLRLKYFPGSPSVPPGSSSIDLPASPGERAYLKLRPVSGVPSRLQLRVETDEPNPFVLDLPDGEDVMALEPRQNRVDLRLADHLEVPHDRDFELLVAIPRQAALYRVRLILVPSLTPSSLRVLFFIALVMHLFPIPVAARILVRRHRDQRKRARVLAPAS